MKELGVFFIIAGVITAGLFVWKIGQPNDGVYIIDPSIFMSGIIMVFFLALGVIMVSPEKELKQ